MHQIDKKPLFTAYMHLSGKKSLSRAYIALIVKNLLFAVFFGIYFRADILLEAKRKVFFTLLKDLALDNYPLNIGINSNVMNSD